METRQIIKNVTDLIKVQFPDTLVTPVRAQLVTDFRRYMEAPKNRDVNDYHHAHDALFAAIIGRYIEREEFFEKGRLSDNVGNIYHYYEKDRLKAAREKAEKEGTRPNEYGFVIGTMVLATRGKADDKTGELTVISREGWTEDDFKYIKKVLGYKQLLLSTKVGESKGQLFDQQPVSAKGKKQVTGTPLGKDKEDLKLYGYYNSAEIASMALVAVKAKNGKVDFCLLSIPRLMQKKWRDNTSEAQQWLAQKIPPNKEVYVIKRFLPKGQKILISTTSVGNKDVFAEVGFTSSGSLYNMTELILSEESLDPIARMGSSRVDKQPSLVELDEVFKEIIQKMQAHYPLQTYQNICKELKDNLNDFEVMPFDAKVNTINAILKFLGVNYSRLPRPLKNIGNNGYGIGSSSSEGRVVLSGVLDPRDIIVTQSPTGIFETRKTVEEMYQEALAEDDTR